jgi:hypothetical protein
MSSLVAQVFLYLQDMIIIARCTVFAVFQELLIPPTPIARSAPMHVA